MSTENLHLEPEAETEALTWQQAWDKALVHPSVTSFEALAADPGAGSGRAYQWIFLSSIVANAPTLCFAPLVAIATVFGAALYIITTHLSAKLLRGTGAYDQLAFSMAAFIAPLAVLLGGISFVSNFAPIVGFLALPVWLYWLILGVLAVRAVHDFGWGRALLANLLIPGGLVALFIVVLGIFTQPAADVAGDFMTALQAGQYEQAYELSSPGLQAEFGDPAAMAQWFEERQLRPDHWGVWSDRNWDSGVVTVSADVTLANGANGMVQVQLFQVDEMWHVDGFNFQVE